MLDIFIVRIKMIKFQDIYLVTFYIDTEQYIIFISYMWIFNKYSTFILYGEKLYEIHIHMYIVINKMIEWKAIRPILKINLFYKMSSR